MRVGLAGIAASAAMLRVVATSEAPAYALLGVALLPWLAALERAPSLRAAAVLGLAFCLAFVAVVFSWFAAGIANVSGAPLAVGWLVLLACAPLVAPQCIAHALARHVARARLGSSLEAAPRVAFAAASAWVATEAFFPKLLGDALGHGLHEARFLRQAADLGGVHVLSLAILLETEFAFLALRAARAGAAAARARNAALAAALALPLAFAGYGALRITMLARAPADAPVRIAIVQADIDSYERLRARDGSYAVTRRILDEHFALSQPYVGASPVDLVVWPETVYPTTFGAPRSPEGEALDRGIAGFVAVHQVALLFGAYDVDSAGASGREYNAAFFAMPERAAGARADAPPAVEIDAYRKRRLFPFTERIPSWLDGPWLRARLPWAGAWSEGAGPARIELDLASGRRIPVGPLICYDALDPALAEASERAGARLLATLSNDSWFGWGAGPRLHLAVATFRSIETRLPQLRSTNTGVSALIDETGEVIARLGIHERGVLAGELRPRAGFDHALGHGGRWFAAIAALAASIALARGPVAS